MLCCGHSNGVITVRDPSSLSVQQTFQAHTGGLTCMDVRDNLLISCGWSKRYVPCRIQIHGIRIESAFVDPFVKVYDLRMMRPTAPIPFSSGPYLAKFHPTFPSSVVIVSQTGQFQIYDLMEPETVSSKFYQVWLYNLT